jgi:hypothetical protein
MEISMKIICSKSFSKIAKSKYPKSETEPTNPWAVCTDKVGREDKDKYERCVHHIKDQNRKENKKKAGIDDKKPATRFQLRDDKATDTDFDNSWNAQTDGTAAKEKEEDLLGGWDSAKRRLEKKKKEQAENSKFDALFV